MKDKFYFHEVGFRKNGSWDKLRQNLNKVVESRHASLELDKSNKSVIQGTYIEQEDKIVTIYDIEGKASKMALPSYLKCDFLVSRDRKVLLVKNPRRGAIRNIVSIFEDATNFEVFVEARKWDLKLAVLDWWSPEINVNILRVDVEDFLYRSDIEGFMRLEGNICIQTIESIQSGRLVQIFGRFSNRGLQVRDFSLHSNGILKVSNEMNFDAAMSFLDSINFIY